MLHNFLNAYLPWPEILPEFNLLSPLHLRLRENEKNDFMEFKSQKIHDKALLIRMIVLWTILFIVYKKCLNAYLRIVGYKLTHRNQISNTLWSIEFNSIILLYIAFFWESFIKPELSVIILRSFYLHYSGILIYVRNAWLRGLSNGLFVQFLFGVYRQSIEPPDTSILLIRIIDILILDVCRLLYLKWPKKVKQKYTKIIYTIYCILWLYIYWVYVPNNVLQFYERKRSQEQVNDYQIVFLRLWFITHVLDFVWFGVVQNLISSLNMEEFLFSNPTKEAIRFNKLLKDHKEIQHKKLKDKVVLKKELWQTIACAMALKKKIKRLRRSQQQRRESQSEDDNPIIINETN